MTETPSFDGAPRWEVEVEQLRLSDKAIARLPAVSRRIGDRLAEMPRGSRARRWLYSRAIVAGFAALDAADYDYVQRMYSPDVRYEMRAERFFDVVGTYDGWPALQGFLVQLLSVSSVRTSQPAEIIDPGGPFIAVRIEMEMNGSFSGIEMEFEVVHMYELAGGVALRQWTLESETAAAKALAERLA